MDRDTDLFVQAFWVKCRETIRPELDFTVDDLKSEGHVAHVATQEYSDVPDQLPDPPEVGDETAAVDERTRLEAMLALLPALAPLTWNGRRRRRGFRWSRRPTYHVPDQAPYPPKQESDH